MKDLQAIIDERAAEKLRNDLNTAEKAISEMYSDLYLKEINEVMAGRTSNSWSIKAIISNGYVDEILFKKKIADYKEKEAELFVKEVEQLKERVASLNEDISFLH